MPLRLLLPLALVALATPLAAQSRGIRTYANPVDLDYRYNWEQLNRGISYRSGADPVVVPHGGEYFRVPVQRERRILNGTVSLAPGAAGEVAESTFQWATPDVLEAFRSWRQEQVPNRDSRVTLSTERDALGMPLVKLDWRLTDLDRRSFRVFYEVMGRELGRSGAGRVQILD